LKRAQEAFDEGQRKDLEGKRSYKDWEKNKQELMYQVVKAKFSQRPVFKQTLLDTGSRPIAEHCEDKEWGDGKDGTGKNYLGKILMRVRDELRNEEEEKVKEKGAKNKASQPSEPEKKPKKIKTTN